MAEGLTIEAHGLASHLRDAIRLNRARRPGYVRLGGVRAGVASSLLIAAERALLPFAWGLDRAARPFVEAGVPILVADLMPMPASRDDVDEDVHASSCHPERSEGSRRRPDSPPLSVTPSNSARVEIPRHPIPQEDSVPQDDNDRPLRTAALRLGAVRRALRGLAFPEAADALADALRAVRDAEAGEGRRYALTAHVLESAGLMALRAPAYAEASGGATVPLSRRLVAGHLPLVWAALRLDRLAHPVQACGVPLFVSDLPAVPFEAEHAA